MMGIEREPLGRKAQCSRATGGAKGRDDSFDLAVFKGGVDPPHAIDRVCRDPARRNPESIFDGVEALLEPACVMLFTRNNLHVDDDARKVVNRRVLFVGRAQRGLGRRRRRHCCSNQWRNNGNSPRGLCGRAS